MNNFHMRKFVARLLLPFFVIWLAVMPSRSYAVLPLIAYGLSAVSTTGVTVTAADVVGLSIATAGMGALLYLKITAPDGSAVAVSAAPAAVVPAPVAPSVQTVISGYIYSINSVSNFDSAGAACSYMAGYLSTANAPWTYSIGFVTETSCGLIWHANGDSGPAGPFSITSFASGGSCPSGYTLSGTSCVLSVPQAVTQDNRQDFTRAAGSTAYVPISGDLIGSIVGIQGVTNEAGDTISFNGSDSDGRPSSLSIVAKSDGSTNIVQSTQYTDAGGSSYIKNGTITLDSSGSIVATSGYSTSGFLNASVLQASGAATVVAAPAGSLTANPASSEPAVFPSDYARSGEASAATAPLVNAVTNTTTVADPSNLTVTDMPGWGNSFDNLLGWSLPGHVSTCPTGQLDLSSVLGAGNVYAFDAHCQLINDNFAQLRAAMMVVWSIAALFLLLKA